MSWNFGDIFETVADVLPDDAPASIHGDRTLSWAELDRRSNNLARQLMARGAKPDDKVAFYMRNRAEYIEALVACCKARLVHVNINFRYLEREIHYILDNSDSRFVLFSGEFGELLGKLRDRLPKVVAFIQLEDGTEQHPFAERYEDLVENGTGERLGLVRSPDDLLFVYTGGTTGMPKGAMWRHEDLWETVNRGGNVWNENAYPEDLDDHRERLRSRGPGARHLCGCPLMHGTGLFSSLSVLGGGGAVVTLGGVRFDPHEFWTAVQRHRVMTTAIVGDAFAKPLLKALEERPGTYDLSSLLLVVSSGVIFSSEVKKGLLRHHPGLILLDALGATEGVGFANSVTTASGESKTARFQIGEKVKVFTQDHREVKPGSGETGFLALRGAIASGYYKDPEKSAEVFPVIDGVRYSVPGDWCLVAEDGTVRLLGRGSVCINTGGEKVYPEEVEQALKEAPGVEDAVVVGVPDEKWGQAVTAVVQLLPGATLDEESLRERVRAGLAHYKCPKRILQVEKVWRSPSGKVDYAATAQLARERLGL